MFKSLQSTTYLVVQVFVFIIILHSDLNFIKRKPSIFPSAVLSANVYEDGFRSKQASFDRQQNIDDDSTNRFQLKSIATRQEDGSWLIVSNVSKEKITEEYKAELAGSVPTWKRQTSASLPLAISASLKKFLVTNESRSMQGQVDQQSNNTISLLKVFNNTHRLNQHLNSVVHYLINKSNNNLTKLESGSKKNASSRSGPSQGIINNKQNVARELQKRHAQEVNPECEYQISRKPAIFGLRCDDSEVTENGSIIIEAYKPTRVYVIGRNLYNNLTVAITGQDGSPQDDCTHLDRIKSLHLFNLSLNIGEIIIDLPPPEKPAPYFFCIHYEPESRWFHQGSEPWLRIQVQQDFMPLWAKIITIIVLLSMSGLFSGLNLGLMALDKNELQVIMKCGTEDEKRYATVIEPVRRRGNYLLCSILFSNTLVNSTISVFLEDLSDGLVAIITSTVLIVLFGEILPQAFCSRHGLAVGAKSIWITNFCMFITFPLSYPVSYCLDWALGEEIGHAYDRERLMEFIQVTRDINNLEADEVNIISGALKIKRVQISEVMTRIEDVYMLDENSVLDFETIQAIVGKGYSRIPVHEAGNRRNIKAVLFAKDLALVDPDDRTPVQTMISFYNHPRMFVFEDTTLDKALNEFKTGKSHMAIVQRVIDDGDRDPYYEVTGIVTLEDVIEEIMQMEINDETDTLTDNRRKRRRKDAQVRKDFSQFTNLGTGDSSFNVVTPQLCLAAYQYLATTIEPFTPMYLSDSILRRLLSQKIFYKVRQEDSDSVKRLYTAGEPADYFIMVLEGRVKVICGKENLLFDGGPFSYFGKAALTQCEQGDIMSISATNATGPVTPGGNSAMTLTTSGTSGTPTLRKDSSKPVMSRRDSLAKIVTSQLSLASKKQSVEPVQVIAQVDLSPTGSVRVNSGLETVELVERGSFYFKPDYTVDIIANTSYLKVTRNDYITALKATRVEMEGAALLGEELETSFVVDNLGQHSFYNNDQSKDS